MEEETVVTALPEATDSNPEEDQDISEGPSEDASSDAVSVGKKEVKADRANERIRELIRERNAYKQQLESARGRQEIELDGITPEGIDPEKYAKSVEARASQKAVQEATKAIAFQTELASVGQNEVVKASKVAQEQVSGLIDQGYSPNEALEIYLSERQQIEREILESTSARREASAELKRNASLPQANKTPKNSSFTNAQIDAMTSAEYIANKPEIMRQFREGLIK